MTETITELKIEDGRIGDWMTTYSGKKFYPADPRIEDFDILDIAVALGNINRYSGHCRSYTVGEHSVLVSKMVEEKFALDGLMHDAEEGYINDIIGPVKLVIGKKNTIFALSVSIRVKLAERFGLTWPEPKEVKKADAQILGLEKRALHPRSTDWKLLYPVPEKIRIACLDHERAAEMFLSRFCQLTGTSFSPLKDRLDAYRVQDLKALNNQNKDAYGQEKAKS